LKLIYDVQESSVNCKIIVFKEDKKLKVLTVKSDAVNIVSDILIEINQYFEEISKGQ
jgi:hypothetical protein